MGVLLQIRTSPEDVHRTLKARAAEAGVSLSEFVRQELAKVATRPTQAELARRLRARTPVDLGGATGAGAIREVRDEFDW